MSRFAIGLVSGLLVASAIAATTAPLAAAPFQLGDLVLYRVGDGLGGLSNTGNAVFLDEYAPDGTLVQSIALPVTASGGQRQLIASGTATSEGLLSRSADGHFLLLTGYARDLGGSGSIAGTASATVNRTVGRVDASGAIDTSTALADFADGNNPRGAIATDGSHLWVTGGAGGIRFASLGSTTSTQISTTVTNLRQPAIFGGQLYVSTGSGSTVRIGTVGSGTPTTAGQAITNLPGFPTGGSPYAFVLLDLNPAVPGPDTLYVADDGPAALTKYSLVGGSWVANGTVGSDADDYRGLTAAVGLGAVTLYATRKGGGGAAGGGELVRLTDASGYNGAFSGTPTVLATAANNTAFRGVALAPEPPPGAARENVAVYRAGDGASGLLNTGSAVFLDEWTADGTLVRSLPLPTTASGGNRQLIASGTATSEGLLTRSADRRFLVATGYARDLGGSGSLANTAASAVPRTVGLVNAAGTIDTTTALTDFADGNNPRGAAASDGGSLWVAGGAGGLRFATPGSTTSTQLSTAATNLRQPALFGGQLYVSTGSGSTLRIATVGSGAPTTSGQTLTNLPGFPTSGSPNAFFFADLSAAVPGVDTLYVADDGPAALSKYSLVAGSWTFNGSVGTDADDYRGVVGQVDGATVTLFATRKGGGGATGGGELVRLVDASGYNGTLSGTPVVLAAAANNTAFRGVALMAVCAGPELAVTRTAPASGQVGTPFTYTLAVANHGATDASGVAVQLTLPAGVSFTGATGSNGFTPSLSGGVVTFSGGLLPAGTAVPLTVTVTPTAGGTVTSAAGDVLVDPSGSIAECDEADNNAGVAAATVIGVPNTPPTIQVAGTTPPFLALPASGAGYASGVLADPTDPAATLGIDFTIGDAETPAEGLTVTATSGNAAVVPAANLSLSGSGASRNLKILPAGVGYATITVTVSDGAAQASYTIQYAASAASLEPATTRFLTGAADASTALAVDASYMLVGDDENQGLRLYQRGQSGLPVATFDFTANLGLTDISGGQPREVDIEASTRIGNRLYWLGSMSNSKDGDARPNRNRLFATDLAGSGAGATLSYVGRYDGLRADLLNWDASNLHGLGANYYGLTASAAVGVLPESPTADGFNAEGLAIAPDGATALVGFRAPLVPPGNRTRALVVPVTNLPALVGANPAAGPATFGAPIELDLGGRGIRSMECNASGCLILAGPPADATGAPPADFRVYTWTGNPADRPSLRTTDLAALAADGGFEGIVEVPSPLTDSSPIELVVDNGDTVFYGDSTSAKDLGQPNWEKSRREVITAPAAAHLVTTLMAAPDPVIAGEALVYTLGVTNQGPSNAEPATLSVPLPTGTVFQSLTAPADWSCTAPAVGSGGTVSCNRSSFAPGSAAFSLTVQVLPTVAKGTVLSATATASSPTTDPGTPENQASATATVDTSADLSLALSDAPDPVPAGGDLVYTLSLANAGPSAAAAVSLIDDLPAGTTFELLMAPSGWSCTAPAVGSSGTLTCTQASLAPGAPGAPGTATFTLTVRVAFGLPSGTVLTNAPSASSTTSDPNPGDTQPTATTLVKPLDYFTVPPCRLIDTRSTDGPVLAPSSVRTFQIAGLCGIPAGAKLAAINLTAVGPRAPGYLQLYPGDQNSSPGTSAVNFGTGQTRTNNALLLLANDGTGTAKVFAGTNGAVDLVIDVFGYFE